MRARALLLVLAALLAVPAVALAGRAAATAPQETPLWRQLDRALAVPQVEASRTAALAVDLATGRVVFRRNDTRALVPASNEKLVVSYAALVTLGPAFRMRSDVLGAGTQRGATWHGDLVLKGYGDPTLSSGDLRYLAERVRTAGIRRLQGGVVADETFFDSRRAGPGWKGYFFRNESPPLSALVVDRARYRGVVTPNPALAAAAQFTDALRRAGVAVGRKPRTGRAVGQALPLATALSPPLWQVVRFMDLESDNFTAEMLLKQLGALYGGRGTTAAGAAVVTRILGADGVPLAGVRIADGSGLSRLNRLTARALVAVLQAVWANPSLRKAFRAALPVAGRSGTLRNRMRSGPARGAVYAKTGTTMLSSSLSGFVRDRYAFAIVQNGSPVASWWAQRAQDRFVGALAAAAK